MKRLALVSVILAAACGAVSAQQVRAPASGQQQAERPALSADDQSALLDARIAALKAGLQLTPEQERNWPAVEAALRDNARERTDRIDRFRRSRAEPRDPPARLRRAAEVFMARAAELNRLADAMDPLTRSLDDGQKRRLAVLMRESDGRASERDRRQR